MTEYAVTVKYVHKRAGDSIEDAITRELQELPLDALVIEANAFPSRVARVSRTSIRKPEKTVRDER
ncbi:MAG: hypothetical protein WC551_09745 [Patescibacteria group bacterium]